MGWIGADGNKAAIVVNTKKISNVSTLFNENNIVAISADGNTFISVYFPPTEKRVDFEDRLKIIEKILRESKGTPVILGGDVNARSKLWGDVKTNLRGRIMEKWIQSHNLLVMNTGSTPTCVRPRGSSIVDITLANMLALQQISAWKVSDDESMSDHLYIQFRYTLPTQAIAKPYAFPRWNNKTFNPELCDAAINTLSWCYSTDNALSISTINSSLLQATKASLKKKIRTYKLPAQPWWSAGINDLRNACTKTRRRWQRLKRKNNISEEATSRAELEYRSCKRKLKTAIRKAKEGQWKQTLAILDDDPWGRPYKWTTRKDPNSNQSITESLDPTILETVLDGLFPHMTSSIPVNSMTSWDPNLSIQPEEIKNAIKRMLRKATAPGPSGIPHFVTARPVENNKQQNSEKKGYRRSTAGLCACCVPGYDSVLRTQIPPSAEVIGCADDTLILIADKNLKRCRAIASLATQAILNQIRHIGLQVAASKTAAVCYSTIQNTFKHNNNYIMIDNTKVPFAANFK
ncbi:uncharacterized protein LOC108622066 [Ceratina calcarata]|uniref:Uncharacterized protein LOC108622066 n=1 Tax=Ceratina calcarata TaxID=156304 RepID=A0AAJ7IR56_9HYME|nr:uncharacterized protein LOC108622066 [Ceratina calcarata]